MNLLLRKVQCGSEGGIEPDSSGVVVVAEHAVAEDGDALRDIFDQGEHLQERQ